MKISSKNSHQFEKNPRERFRKIISINYIDLPIKLILQILQI